MYKVGQSVVHLSHGVGVVRGIEEREFSPGKKQRFYILDIQDNGACKKVFVPFGSEENRLRPIVKVADAKKVYALLAKPQVFVEVSTWSKRYRDYMEKIHTGDVFAIAEVFKSLVVVGKDKDLSFGERKLLEHAKTLLVRELMIATDKTENEVEAELENSIDRGTTSR